MANTTCICGNFLSNVSCPSDVEYHIFTRETLEEAIATDPNILLLDFQMEWDDSLISGRIAGKTMDKIYCSETAEFTCPKLFLDKVRAAVKP